MNPDWDGLYARTRGMSARTEAALIRDLAAARAKAARKHAKTCWCRACCTRRRDEIRKATAAYVATQQEATP